MVLKSAEVEHTAGVVFFIQEKPSQPIVWRFNDSEFLNKLTFASIKATIENNVAKMVSTNPAADDGFYFFVDMPQDCEQFNLEDYGYIRMKYKREGIAPGQIYYYSDAISGDPSFGVG